MGHTAAREIGQEKKSRLSSYLSFPPSSIFLGALSLSSPRLVFLLNYSCASLFIFRAFVPNSRVIVSLRRRLFHTYGELLSPISSLSWKKEKYFRTRFYFESHFFVSFSPHKCGWWNVKAERERERRERERERERDFVWIRALV